MTDAVLVASAAWIGFRFGPIVGAPFLVAGVAWRWRRIWEIGRAAPWQGWVALLAILITTALWFGIDALKRHREEQRIQSIVAASGRTMNRPRSLQFVGPAIRDENLVHVRGLHDTEWLELHSTCVKGPGLANLADWTGLKYLFLNNNPIEDDALVHLAKLQNLERLELNQTNITDGAIPHLSRLANLRELNISNTDVSESGASRLREMLPNCKIRHGQRP